MMRGTPSLQLDGFVIRFREYMSSVLFCVGYLTTLSIPGLYSVDDKIINEYGAVGGMEIGKGNQNSRESNLL
jgi:hypothetical protein